MPKPPPVRRLDAISASEMHLETWDVRPYSHLGPNEKVR
jgi:hypothetical protein